MNNQVLFKFLEELRLQCRLGRLAYDQFRTSLQGLDPEKTFCHLHAFLGFAGNASRLLWPARPASHGRGERLRSELKLTDNSPLKLRNLRPILEAPDEHFEDWVGTMEVPNYVGFNIMPQGTMLGYKQDAFQRNLDPETYQFVFRGESCDLRQIANELQRVESAAQQWLKTHNPW